jgi:DHA1 family multidrug resistance protein-like MFS transporter
MVYYHRNMLVLSLTTFIGVCSFYQIIPFIPLFIKELGVTNRVVFWVGVTLTAQMVAAIVMMPYWGKLADRYGSKLMIIRAEICVMLTFLGVSYCQNLCQLLLLWVLNGILTGFIPAVITFIATNTPKPEAPRYVAVIQFVATFAALTGPMVGSIMVNWLGFRSSIRASCILMFVTIIFVFLLVKEQRKVTTYVQPTSLWQDFRLALKKTVLVTALYSDMTYAFVTISSQPLLILYIQELTGLRANLFTGLIFSLPGLAVVLTNYCWCRLGERYTFQRIILLGLTGAGFFTTMQGMVRNIWWFAATYFLAGLFSAAISPNTAGLVATKVERDFQGRAFALQQSSRSFGSFLAPLLAGFLGDIITLQWVFIVVGLLGLTAAIVIRVQMSAYLHSEMTIGTQEERT